MCDELTCGSTPVQDGTLFELTQRSIQFDMCRAASIMKVDTALHLTSPAQLRQVVDLMGGLAPDTDEPMDTATRDYVQHGWRAVADRSGAQFNFPF
ncbi:MAG TPA: hypothetical protein DG761_10225 [Gammaproteobacteria bacterium]|nr:hypothetical protein [Acidiferrobacteraceae bacterium]HCX88389.1 hypothetical protein [Gammaproteobacteria bacterium]